MAAVEKLLAKHSEDLKPKNRNNSGKKPKQITAELKVELNALLKKWKTAQDKKDKKKKEEKENKSEKHSPSSGQLSAVLWRNSSYNLNCSKYLKKNKARGDVFRMTPARENRIHGSFDNFIQPVCVDFIINNFGLGDNNPENFTPNAKINSKTAGNAYPYAWNGHHMIPCGAFYQGQKKDGMLKEIFNEDQYALLLMSDFNVNHGQNVIPLPSRHPFFQAVHDMVLHPSNHNNYTKMVQEKMKKVAKGLEELTDQADEPHPEISVAIAEELSDFEDKLWKEFVKMGKEEVDAANASRKAEHGSELNVVLNNGALC